MKLVRGGVREKMVERESGWKAGVMFLWGWPRLYSASFMFMVEQIDPLLFSTSFVNHNFIHVHSVRQFTLRFSTMVCNTKSIFDKYCFVVYNHFNSYSFSLM